MTYRIGNNYKDMESPVLREALDCVEAQIWSVEDQLAALQLTRASMMNVLQARIRHDAIPTPRLPLDTREIVDISP